MSFSTPAEIVAQAERAALNKISLSFPRTLVAAMLAGIYIATEASLPTHRIRIPRMDSRKSGVTKTVVGLHVPFGTYLGRFGRSRTFHR